MLCYNSVPPPLLSAAAITHSLMGSHQSQSARRYSAATVPLHRLLGSMRRSRDGGGESSVARPHSHVCGFVSSACLLIGEPQNGPRTRLRAPGPPGECRVNVAAVSGGPGCVHVWCQKQLIGFSLQSVQSAVSSDKESEHMTERREFRPIGSFHRVFISQARSRSQRVEAASQRFSTLACHSCFVAGCESHLVVLGFLNNNFA